MIRVFRKFCLLPSIFGIWCVYNVYTINWHADPYLWPVKWANILGAVVCFSGIGLNLLLLPLQTREEEELERKKRHEMSRMHR
jgi:hypothetical protein